MYIGSKWILFISSTAKKMFLIKNRVGNKDSLNHIRDQDPCKSDQPCIRSTMSDFRSYQYGLILGLPHCWNTTVRKRPTPTASASSETTSPFTSNSVWCLFQSIPRCPHVSFVSIFHIPSTNSMRMLRILLTPTMCWKKRKSVSLWKTPPKHPSRKSSPSSASCYLDWSISSFETKHIYT